MSAENEKNTVLSTRVRLARNIKGKPFPSKMSVKDAEELIDVVYGALASSALGTELTLYKMHRLSDAEKQSLVEKHLISRNLAAGKLPSAAIVSRDKRISVMVNEEDHIRLQVFRNGLDTASAYEEAQRLIRLIGEKVEFEYDADFGYLTSCPTNVGTGMRVSVMLHLPAIGLTKSETPLIKWATNAAMTVRGVYGEGSKASGALYQLSNQRTLGISDADILRAFQEAATALVNEEQRLCNVLAKDKLPQLKDKCRRSLGLLKHAYMISSSEAMQLVSDVCLGQKTGIISNVDIRELYATLFEVMPATMLLKGDTQSSQQRDIQRAQILQNAVKEV